MFGGIVGAAVAAVWLILKPVDIVDSPRRNQDELPVRHAVNYQPGKLGLVRESQVKVKERAVLQQSEAEVSLSEQEINRWLVTRYGASSPRDLMGTGIEVRPEPPLIRMVGDEMQIGVVYSFSGYDGKKNMVLQTTGRFDRSGSGRFEFVPTKTYLGSFPLPSGFVSRFVFNKFLSGFAVSDELGKAWSGLQDVVLADGHLKLRFGGAVAAPPPEPERVLEPAPLAAPAVAPPAEVGLPADEGAGSAAVPVAVEDVLTTTAEAAVAAMPDVNAETETKVATPGAEAPTEDAVPESESFEGGAIDPPDVPQEAPAPTAVGTEEEAESTAAPEPDAVRTLTVENGSAEKIPASAPLESN